ncbi:hypothetical protein BDN72DRAFT_815341 [Pluteus cervinus]|uniref:Uncharacterized protein n=1 Tax=Pluteus cervinus TaxID=181527 RepID=A0ACD3B561_9AGAR|nr:hypothetical protein BDN72DRAFT_815341 [Pluteus cervinus]
MEDGEINEPSERGYDIPEYTYDASYEWPGDTDLDAPSENDASSSHNPIRHKRKDQSCLRLLVSQSSILPQKQTLAVLDGYSEVQFGRDVAPQGSTTPRIRLKEMEVSKLHATTYWDGARKKWCIVDMGSKHGTFLRSASTSSSTLDDIGTRLSLPRIASIPQQMHHLDYLTIGSTQFIVHIHATHLPCEKCASSGENEIPMGSVSRAKTGVKRRREQDNIDAGASSGYAPKAPQDARKSLTLLKQSLLTRHQSKAQLEQPGPSQYTDRSARRRALHPVSAMDSPGVGMRPLLTRTSTTPPPLSPQEKISPVSEPPQPLPPSNVGHRLLLKQGWSPGTALGLADEASDGIRLVEPLEISINAPRAGLGSKADRQNGHVEPDSTCNWREEAKQKRWDAARRQDAR